MEIKQNQITCANCHIIFWITEQHNARLIKDKQTFYCPNGHAQIYPGISCEQKLKEMTNHKNRYEEWYNEIIEKSDKMKKQINGYKGIVKRLQNEKKGE